MLDAIDQWIRPMPGGADRANIRRSVLWNVNHVEHAHDPSFMDTLGKYVVSP